jgi:hypothetical protein
VGVGARGGGGVSGGGGGAAWPDAREDIVEQLLGGGGQGGGVVWEEHGAEGGGEGMAGVALELAGGGLETTVEEIDLVGGARGVPGGGFGGGIEV